MLNLGEEVTTGQVIGVMGSSGISSGPHLHFEIRKDGQAVDPELIFNSEQRRNVIEGRP
jgi:murein DD-endopeptidase MepM/ murein hydrolase activator NlpD